MHRILHVHEPGFPADLRYKHGPLYLEALGPLSDRLDQLGPSVAIVGTRRPTEDAERFAFQLAASLAHAGVVVLSGGAYGIDAAAHEGALSVEGGKTIAFLPSSIERWSPAGNAALFRRIERTGALVAFLQRHEAPRFHERNAAIAAFAKHVVVVAAPIKSGARNTAAEARTFKRPLWVVPGAPWDPTMSGCAVELSLGAKVLLGPEPILRALDLPCPARPQRRRRRPIDPATMALFSRARERSVTDLEPPASSPTRETIPGGTVELDEPAPVERRLLESLREAPKSLDELVSESGLGRARLYGLLLTWRAEGVVREGPLGRFRLASS